MSSILREHHTLFLNDLKKRNKASSTLLAYGKDVEQFLQHVEAEGIKAAHEVVIDHVEAFAVSLREKRYTDKSIVRKLNSLKAFFSFLRNLGIVEKNPVSRVTKPRYENALPRVLTKLEYRALRDACRADRRMSAVVEILLQTGVRISELAAMQVEDADLTKKTLLVRQSESGKPRVVPLNNAAIRAFNDYMEIRPKARENTLFLTKTCRPFLVRNIRAAIDRYFRIAGVEGAKVNDLRHTFIVEQLAAGTPLVYVSQVVGHKRVTTTEKYLQLIGKTLDATMVKIEEL